MKGGNILKNKDDLRKKGVLFVEDLKWPVNFIEKEIKGTEGPTCTICSDCCLCETGGV